MVGYDTHRTSNTELAFFVYVQYRAGLRRRNQQNEIKLEKLCKHEPRNRVELSSVSTVRVRLTFGHKLYGTSTSTYQVRVRDGPIFPFRFILDSSKFTFSLSQKVT